MLWKKNPPHSCKKSSANQLGVVGIGGVELYKAVIGAILRGGGLEHELSKLDGERARRGKSVMGFALKAEKAWARRRDRSVWCVGGVFLCVFS